MKLSNIPVPDVYARESADFRFFLDWIQACFEKIQYDHEHALDLYDPLRCPRRLLWMLADTIGYKYDDRLPPAFCRLVLLYFMSMIKLKGSKNGVMLAAEVNLAQFNINEYGKEKEILYDRLEDTSIPVNSVSVIPHVDEGYIDVVYFSDRKPTDACIEYVRPLGMYLFPHAGVVVHSRTKITVDGRLASGPDLKLSIGPTHIGHYSREDYARMQKMKDEHSHTNNVTRKDHDFGVIKIANYHDKDDSITKDGEIVDYSRDQGYTQTINASHNRKGVWRHYAHRDKYGNIQNYELKSEEITTYNESGEEISGTLNPGYRALYNLQLSNNEHIVKSLLRPMFSQGYGPQPGGTESDDYYRNNEDVRDDRPWDIKNMRYDKLDPSFGDGWSYLNELKTSTNTSPNPRINPILARIGDSIPMSADPFKEYDNSKYTKSNDTENKGRKIVVKNESDV